MKMEIDKKQLRLVAIIRGFTLEQTIRATECFVKAGIKAVEVTYNTQGASEIIAALHKEFGQELLLGAGTVVELEQVEAARDAGAQFILSPDCNIAVIKATKETGLFSIPGVLTATEVSTAFRAGADMVKLFPAGRMGPGYLGDLLGPFSDAEFMVVGAIGLDNIRSYYQAGAISAGVGSSLVDSTLMREKRYAELTVLAKNFVSQLPSN